jgi:FKBP-type peptidyl-prolyl cis-trans isomerase FkpA
MKHLLSALVALTLFISCSDTEDKSPIDYKGQNDKEISDYIAKNEINAEKSTSGLYHVINEPGTGKQATVTSNITVAYKVYLTNGTILEQSPEEGVSLNLNQSIPGWIEGIPHFKEGGSGILLIPSHLAYGSINYGNIPAGSVLIFDIKLISVNGEYNEPIDYTAKNDKAITDYIAKKELNAVKTDSGLYYVIDEPGTGKQPTASSNVTLSYKAYFTNDTVLEESPVTGVTLNLNQTIKGWIEGIPYFKEGGSGTLLIPAHLAYGSYNYKGIPGGSVLIFDVKLISVN